MKVTETRNAKGKPMKTLDQQINSLKPGQSIKISGNEYGTCHVERSGNGDTLRFIRTIGNTTTVFKSCKF